MALNSKKAEKSKVVTCVSGNMPRPMSIGSDLSDAGKKHCYFLKLFVLNYLSYLLILKFL